MDINLPLESETLTAEELLRITGWARKQDQITWLREKEWRYETNASNEPIVGRLYARFKLAGIDLKSVAVNVAGGPAPRFDKAR